MALSSSSLAIDCFLTVANPAEAADLARELENLGCDGLASFEGPHEPFLPLAVAALNTSTVRLYPAVAIAFARNPMLLANMAYDLQSLSAGRFALGLGSQIRPHIEKRYSMTWSEPVARMREFVAAIRAIWDCWEHNAPLNFEGRFYKHTLMTPLFNPGPNPYGMPPIILAGVGPYMTTMAGEVADGFIVHPFHTTTSLHEMTLPALLRGATRSGRTLEGLDICCQRIVATGHDETELAQSIEAAKMQIAFYGSTPAYRPVLECHGLGDLQEELNKLSKAGHWSEMGQLIDDKLLRQIALVGTPTEVAQLFMNDYANTAVNRIAPSLQHSNPKTIKTLIAALVQARQDT